ncbi:hypothetical protein ACQKQD_32435 [Methylobacterium sp. NPDC080182]|uniref:hypothetical protein n=1 Tax=Methylobacterium sp. NPDC080182 TaxID=3390590 RepID=UPI003D00EC36
MPLQLTIKSEHTLIAGRDLIATQRMVPRLPTPMELVIASPEDVDDWERFPRGFVHTVVFDGGAGVRFGIRIRTHNGSLTVVQDFDCPYEASRADFGWRCGFMHALHNDDEIPDDLAAEIRNGRRNELERGLDLRKRMEDGDYIPFVPVTDAIFDGHDFGRWPHGYYFPAPAMNRGDSGGYMIAQNIAGRMFPANDIVYDSLSECSLAILDRMAERVYVYGITVMPRDLNIKTDLRLWEAVADVIDREPAAPALIRNPAP